MNVIEFQAADRLRFQLIDQIRAKRQREDPGTDYTFAHYYNPEWRIEELIALAEPAAEPAEPGPAR